MNSIARRATSLSAAACGLLGIVALVSCGGNRAQSSSSPVAPLPASLPERQARDADTSESVIFSFSDIFGGPTGELIRDKAGDFYGTAFNNGAFELAPSGSTYVLKRRYYFQGGYDDGSAPNSGLVRDESQALYGTAYHGGDIRYCSPPNGCGVVFKLTPSRSGFKSTVLYRFEGGTDGEYPAAGLITDQSGSLYGTTRQGGAGPMCPYGCGTVFKLAPNSGGYVESILHTFQSGSNGQQPQEMLAMDPSGALYGTASGGSSNDGVVFKLTPSGSAYSDDTLYSFKGGADGALPSSPLVIDKSGAVYGTTAAGGDAACAQGYGVGCGTVFKLTPGADRYHHRVLYAFQGAGDGVQPNGLTLDGAVLYGTTAFGGSTACGNQGCGTVFALKPRKGGSEHVVYGFASGGVEPAPGLVVEKGGALIFGETENGGADSYGTVFEITQ